MTLSQKADELLSAITNGSNQDWAGEWVEILLTEEQFDSLVELLEDALIRIGE